MPGEMGEGWAAACVCDKDWRKKLQGKEAPRKHTTPDHPALPPTAPTHRGRKRVVSVARCVQGAVQTQGLQTAAQGSVNTSQGSERHHRRRHKEKGLGGHDTAVGWGEGIAGGSTQTATHTNV